MLKEAEVPFLMHMCYFKCWKPFPVEDAYYIRKKIQFQVKVLIQYAGWWSETYRCLTMAWGCKNWRRMRMLIFWGAGELRTSSKKLFTLIFAPTDCLKQCVFTCWLCFTYSRRRDFVGEGNNRIRRIIAVLQWQKMVPFAVLIPWLQRSRKAGLIIKKDLKKYSNGISLTLSAA